MGNFLKSISQKWSGNYFSAPFFRLSIVLTVIFILPGCGTVISRNHNPAIPDSYGLKYPEGGNPPRIYSGTTADLLTLEGSGHNADGGLTLLLDLPLSFVADTVLLPVTVYEQFFAKQTFQVAAARGDIHAMKEMLDAGQDINEKDFYGLTALMQSAWSGHLDAVQLLVDKGTLLNEQHETTGATALMYAVNRRFDKDTNMDYANIALLLLNSGAKVNAKNGEGQSALMLAVKNDNSAMMKALLDNGADINSTDNHGWSILTNAVRMNVYFGGSKQVVQMLLDAGADVASNEVCMSIGYGWRGDTTIFAMLLNKVGNPNALTCDGTTTLATAAGSGRLREVQLLIEKGAQVNAIIEGGPEYCMSCSALMHAIVGRHVDVVQTLINNGADVNARNHSGQTALTLAVNDEFAPKEVRSKLIDLLKKNGAKEL